MGAECGVVDGGCSSSSGGSGELSSLTAAQKKRRKKVERKRKWHVAQQQENAEQQMALLTGRSASPTDVPSPLTVATGVGSSGDSSSSSRGPDRSPSKALQAEREARLWAAAQLEQSKAKKAIHPHAPTGARGGPTHRHRPAFGSGQAYRRAAVGRLCTGASSPGRRHRLAAREDGVRRLPEG